MAERESHRRWNAKKGSKANQSEPSRFSPSSYHSQECFTRHVGTIKNFNQDKGFGFIDCPAVEKDIFVHQRQINGFKIGDRVLFKIDEDVKGVKAVELEYADEHEDYDHLALRRSDSRRGWDQHEPPEQDGRPRHDYYEGRIRHIHEQGYGFIDCADLSNQDDVYCDRRQMKGFNVGDRVKFHIRNMRGRLQAVGLSHAGSSGWGEFYDYGRSPRDEIPDDHKVEEEIRDDILNRLWHTVRETPEASDGLLDMGRHDQANTMNDDHTNGTGHDRSNTIDAPAHQGVIKMFDEGKGYGFIFCPAMGGDVFLPKVQFKGMKVGQSVNFFIRPHKGKPQAFGLRACEEEVDGTALIMDSFATQSSPSNQRREPCHGVVKNFDPEKGYGFISCKELFEIHGCDTFVHQKGLKKGLTDLTPGDHVSFFIRVDDKSRPQAMRVSLCEPPSEGGEGDPFSINADTISYSGTIKSFVSTNDNEGYGFISCPEVLEKYKRDAFVHMKQIKDFKPGDAVKFSVRKNNLGHPQAYDLREAPNTVAWLSAADTSEEPAEKEEMLPDKEEHFGRIKSFNEKQGYGFIHCEELHGQYGRDVFIPQSQFKSLNIGDQVSFHIQVKRGQPQAHDVVCVLARTLSNHQSELQKLEGAALDKKLLRMCASARVDSVNEIAQLLEAGANPNTRDVTGQTTLMIAALNVRHSERKCRLLIEANAKLDMPSSKAANSKAVLEWARERINPSFAAFLEACTKGDAPDCEIELAKPPGDEF